MRQIAICGLPCYHAFPRYLINGTIFGEIFFSSLSLLIGWQLSIWICRKAVCSLLYNCQLLCFWRLALSIVVKVSPLTFFPNIAPYRMFTTNSLCLTVCSIHEWRLFLKFFKSNLSSFALWKTSSLLILSVHFIFTILLQHPVSNAFTTLSSFVPRVHVSDPQTATLQIQLFISFFFISKLKLFETEKKLRVAYLYVLKKCK